MNAPVDAQERFRVANDVPFRKTGNGVTLGTMVRGTEISVRRTEGAWVEIRLDGWMINSSLARTNRDGFDVNVVPRRENLRIAPNGTTIARVSTGALFNRVEDRGGWTHLRRDVWIPRSALASLTPTTTAQRSPARDTTRRSTATRDTIRNPPGGVGAGIAPPSAPGDNIEAATSTRLLATPDGAVLGNLASGTRARVVSRSGNWVRVQVEAWVRDDETRPTSDSGAMTGVSAAEVRAAPARYLGKVVDWRLQFLAVQKADELRPEIPLGRYYLLTRGPLPESGFVYVIIPQDQVERFRATTPLEELLVRGTIKAATTRYLPNPVLDLVAIGN
ncbi:MAG: hypothetical protein ABI679_05335 [Gemmatimonadota bacterium]